jgi:hypothetical protein
MLVCDVFLHSRFIENPLINPKATNPSFMKCFCHTTPQSSATTATSSLESEIQNTDRGIMTVAHMLLGKWVGPTGSRAIAPAQPITPESFHFESLLRHQLRPIDAVCIKFCIGPSEVSPFNLASPPNFETPQEESGSLIALTPRSPPIS